MRNAPGGRLRCWRARRCAGRPPATHSAEPGIAVEPGSSRRDAGGTTGAGGMSTPGTRAGQTNSRQASASRAAAGESVAAAMQAAIGLLTASLDSPELEARALPVLIPQDASGLGDLMAGLHLISELLIRELHEATGEPPQATLQRLAMLAEHRRGMPSTG
jgi:hypothetical protein